MMAKHAGHGSLIVKRKCAAVNEDEPAQQASKQPQNKPAPQNKSTEYL